MPREVPSNRQRFNVYDAITQTIIEAVEAGACGFVLPWHQVDGGRPRNAVTDTPYNGINVVALWAASVNKGYRSNRWATYRQWTSAEAQVRHGEKASAVLFYKPLPSPTASADGADNPEGRRFVARASWVFNADQVDGWIEAAIAPATTVECVTAAERLVVEAQAVVTHGGAQAFYAPKEDRIYMPPSSMFVGSTTRTATEAYYAVLLHELIHWTGASHRLDRVVGRRFGDRAYAFEELVAELGAAFLCADVGLANEPRPDHAAYIADWLAILSQDARAIVAASRLAGEAAAYLQSSP